MSCRRVKFFWCVEHHGSGMFVWRGTGSYRGGWGWKCAICQRVRTYGEITEEQENG